MNQRGQIALEASLVLPLVLLAILVLGVALWKGLDFRLREHHAFIKARKELAQGSGRISPSRRNGAKPRAAVSFRHP
jgi:hypothetical protein